MKRLFTYTLILISAFLSASAQKAEDVFEKCTYDAPNGLTINYRLLRPLDHAAIGSNARNEKYPLVIFMHGSGERGDDNEHQLDNGGDLFANIANREEFPSYVIFPQCPNHCFWSYKSAPKKSGPKGLKAEKKELPLMAAIMSLIDEYKQMPDIDPDRVYIVGLSMGGMAVFDMACRHPDEFAAAVSICGAIDPDRVDSMKDVPIRIFHGKKDDVVPVIASEVVYERLKSLGDEVEIIEFPNDGHNSWDSAFKYPDFLSWIFSHDKSLLANHNSDFAHVTMY